MCSVPGDGVLPCASDCVLLAALPDPAVHGLLRPLWPGSETELSVATTPASGDGGPEGGPDKYEDGLDFLPVPKTEGRTAEPGPEAPPAEEVLATGACTGLGPAVIDKDDDDANEPDPGSLA